MKSRICTWCTALFCLCLPACSDSSSSPQLLPPDQPGSFLAGHLSDSLLASEDLELNVLVWYPVAQGSEEEYSYDGLGVINSQVVLQGQAECASPRPVVVFSHGNSGVNFQSFSLTEHLARHGFLVAAPSHVFNTALDMDEELKPYLFMRRPRDVRETFDWLVAQAARPDSPLRGCLDPEAGYAVVGHSFGGFTSLATAGATLDMVALEADCAGDQGSGCTRIHDWRQQNPGQDSLDVSDERVWAAVPLAPAWYYFLGEGLEHIGVPTAIVGGQGDVVTTWEGAVVPAYTGLNTVPRMLVGLANAGHYSFTDYCALVGETADGCGEGYRPVADVLETIDVLVLAFLQRTRGFAQADEWLPPEEGIFHFEQVRK